MKKTITIVLSILIIFSIIPIEALAATKISKAAESTLLPSAYAFQPRFISGKTTVTPIGTVTTSSDDCWCSNGVTNFNDVYTFKVTDDNLKGKIGCWYKNVGNYNGKPIDLKITVIEWSDRRTEYTKTTTGDYNGKSNYPTILFLKNTISIGVQARSFRNVQYKYEYYYNGTNTPVTDIKGHITFGDIDAYESVALTDANIYRGYITSNSVLSINSNKISSGAASSEYNDTKNYLEVLFNGSPIQFTYDRSSDSDLHTNNYNASKRTFFSILFKGDSSIPYDTPEISKSVSAATINTNDTLKYSFSTLIPMQPSNKSYTSFVISDTLEDSIELADNNLTVTNDIGQNVSNHFTLSSDGQTVKITGLQSFVSGSSFGNKEYTFTVNVKPKDNYAFTVSNNKVVINNTASVSTNYGTKNSNNVSTEIKFNITTEIVNGNITESESNITGGSDRTITFTPDEDHYVSSIIVDGQPIDAAPYKSGGAYTFNTIVSDHNISVICTPYEYFNINIKYLDESNNSIADDFNQSLRADTPYNVSEIANKSILYYTLVSIEGDTKGTINNNVNIIVRYTKNQCKAIINYLEKETGHRLTESVEKTYSQGDEYNLINETKMDFPYYTFDSIDSETSGTITEDIVINVYYVRNQNTVTINYVDKESGELLAESVTNTFPQGTEYNVISDTNKKIEHYTIDNINGEPEGMIIEDINIDVFYNRNRGTVNVNYLDEDGKSIADSETYNGYVSEEYNTAAKGIYGYKLTKTPDNASGTYSEDIITVDYIYTLKDTKIIVNYVDTNGSKLADSDIINGKVFDKYKTAPKQIDRYTLKNIPENHEGIMEEETITVTYIYDKIPQTVTINNIPNNNNKPLKSPNTGADYFDTIELIMISLLFFGGTLIVLLFKPHKSDKKE